ncbi:hypothetical protein PFFVO_06051 [Plasmodium falciparum Vietnam Oak-Knoll (FVO)]|uniref:Duffy-binding-like domain-containing protein n=1 Tax=Plasmodium falciparum Vietnam Oak-Knoll (FVO) TaxID=1036723 RepID=A0A024UW73_PLAFA|nr:hypothetical protein PFFVO_06051 [Plasmodium falciparum Vietnam Oak-Knoll (FVO)]
MKKIIEKNRNKFDLKKEDDNAIDILLEHELQEAKKCVTDNPEQNCKKKTPKKQLTTDASREGPARSLPSSPQPRPTATSPNVQQPQPRSKEDASSEDSDEDDEDGDEVEEDTTGSQEDTGQTPAIQDNTEESVDACGIVNTLFTTTDTLEKACPTKYGPGKNYGWKCVSSGDSTTTSSGNDGAPGKSGSDSGSICIPPRRRKLYLHKIEGVDTTDDKSLRDWFVKSAAVETFFSWHKYKKENTKTQGVGSPLLQTTLDNGTPPTDDDKDPEKLLQKGEIPDDFLRQMFYTFGDYKDIFFGKDVGNGKDLGKDSATTSISENIARILNSDSQPSSGEPNNKREEWWEQHGPAIWDGMVCALGYNTENRTKDDNVHKQLMEVIKNNKKYNYHTVIFSSVGPSSSAKLDEFSRIPQYFRWFQEWGETFCRQRTRMLKNVKDNCMEEDGTKQKYSGDGEDCEDIFRQEYNVLQDLSSSCAKPCRFYRKWIEKKKDEYDKQKEAYNNQKANVQNNNDNAFSGTLEKYKDAAAFLENLGSCKKDNGEGKKFFENEGEAFRPATNCKPCSQFKIDCRNGNCKIGGGTNDMCNGKIKTITAENIKTSTADIGMLVSDNDAKGFDGLQACGSANIFKGIRKEEWKCGNVCGYVVCKTEKVDGKANSEKQFITIRALLHRWLEYFLDDYNKIKHKISHCMEKGEGNICKKDCQNKCKCVGQWIEKKRAEWETIRGRFNEQYKNADSDNSFPVRSVLETFLVQIGAANYEDKVIKLSQFDKSCGCSADASAQKKDSNEKDAIDCMLKKLEEKAKKCKEDHSQTGDKTCSPPPQQTLDLDDQIDEDTENKVAHPKICGEMDAQPEQQEEEGGCDAPEEKTKENDQAGAEELKPPADSPPAGPTDQESRKPKRTWHHHNPHHDNPKIHSTTPLSYPPW